MTNRRLLVAMIEADSIPDDGMVSKVQGKK
jgi:hypothetical protein